MNTAYKEIIATLAKYFGVGRKVLAASQKGRYRQRWRERSGIKVWCRPFSEPTDHAGDGLSADGDYMGRIIHPSKRVSWMGGVIYWDYEYFRDVLDTMFTKHVYDRRSVHEFEELGRLERKTKGNCFGRRDGGYERSIANARERMILRR